MSTDNEEKMQHGLSLQKSIKNILQDFLSQKYMSNFYVCYSDEAKDDFRNIFMYIVYNLGSRDNAEGQVNRILEAIKKLDKFPIKKCTRSI